MLKRKRRKLKKNQLLPKQLRHLHKPKLKNKIHQLQKQNLKNHLLPRQSKLRQPRLLLQLQQI